MEVELKFQVPAARRSAVLGWVRGKTTPAPRRERLQAAYFDTPDRLLAQAGLALRLRREGRRWVQTLKGLGADGLSREEHNLPLDTADRPPGEPTVDPRRHAGVPVGQRLLALLAGQPEQALRCTYRTDILRLSRALRSRLGRVELAFDEGWLIAGEARLPVCELEIELLDGHPGAVIDVARRWALRHGLWLDSRSKAERGDLLSRGMEHAPPCRAGELVLHRGQTPRAALQAVISHCREQIVVNASQVAAGVFEPEHVHQLRVGLRRLRSGLQLFADDAAAAALAAPLAEPAARLFRRLGAARDAAVLEGEVAAALQRALAEIEPAARLPLPAPSPVAEAPAEVLRDPLSQGLLLDLIAAGLPPEPAELPRRRSSAAPGAVVTDPVTESAREAPAQRLRPLLAQRLARWHRAILKDAAAFDALDIEARHRLRKRIKRLRYAAEFAAGLHEPARVRATLKPLRRVQERLGLLNDVALGLAVFGALKDREPHAGFALGWLLARRDALLAGAPAELRALADAPRFWKK